MSVPAAETAQERLARLEVPVKHEFCRFADSRISYVDALGGTNGDGAKANQVMAPKETTKKSRNAMKKERLETNKTNNICFLFVKGECKRGDGCKSSHNVAEYLNHKPADLEGECPFSNAEICPYGITCRWATKHKNMEPDIKEFLEKQQQHAANATAEPEKQLMEEEAVPVAAFAPPTAAANGQEKTTDNTWWWRMDDSISILPNTVTPGAAIASTVNIMPKEIQYSLWKNGYDFNVADDAMKKHGINNNAKKRDKKGKGEKSAANGADDGAEKDPKKPRLDPEVQQQNGEEKVEEEAAVYVETKMHSREKKTIDFRGKTFLAPLTTVGNLPFRRLAKSLGADVTCGEMALATNILQGQASEWALLKRHPDEDCFGVQLCGGFGDAMTRCAQLVEDHLEVDFVDINFGCPIDVVINKGAGSACLQRPRRMQDIIKGMTSVLSCPVTLKMRKGYNDGQDIAHTLLPSVKQWGASAVTLHGRTREQRYSRLADWDYIKKCADIAAPSGLQLIGNGDVMSWEDHQRAVNEVGVATTYVARGALIKPWVFTEIKEHRDWDISANERFDLIRKFSSYGLEHWGSDSRGVETTRRFLLEWLSFSYRYVPIGVMEVLPQRTNHRPPAFVGRSDLETLLASPDPRDWIKISEMILGPVRPGFVFTPKHKATSYAGSGGRDNNTNKNKKEAQEQEF